MMYTDIRWAVNVLLEKIAVKFEEHETLEIWRSDAAFTVREFKHDLTSPNSMRCTCRGGDFGMDIEGCPVHDDTKAPRDVSAQETPAYQSLSTLCQEWLAKAREYEECADQGDISSEEVCLYMTSAEILRECESKLHPFIAAGKVIIEVPKPYSNINECPYCKRMFKDGETCTRGCCPMGGDF